MAEVTVVSEGDDAGAEEVADAATETASAVAEAVADATERIADAMVEVAEAVADASEVPPEPERHEEWRGAHEELARRVEGLEGQLSGGLAEIGTQLESLRSDLMEGTEPEPDVDATIVVPDFDETEMADDQKASYPWWHPGSWL